MAEGQPEDLLRAYLVRLGADPGGAGLAETARAATSVLAPFLQARPEPELSLFPAEASSVVVVRRLRFYSLCEHHLLPFFGHMDVAYAPEERLVGFGGLQRCIAHLATRLQLQERLTAQVADFLEARLQPQGLIVMSHARHMCHEMRGGSPEAPVAVMACRGRFHESDAQILFGVGSPA